MAKTVKAMPESKRASRYPWSEWLNGEVWELEPGVDFDCDPDSMRQQMYQAAAAADLSATTREFEGKVYIQATKKPTKRGAKK